MKKRDRKENRSVGKGGGRIGRLDEHTLGYYRRVSHSFQEGFESDEDKEMMLGNVFKTLATEALTVSRNQTVSHIVQKLVQEATISQLVMVMNAFAKDWETACTDRFASHVTQTILTRAAEVISEEVNLDDIDFEGITESPKSLKELIVSIHGCLHNNIAVHMQHTYTSHIVRVLLEVLSGFRVSESLIRSRLSRQSKGTVEKKETKIDTPDEFKPLLKSMTKKVLGMDRLKDLAKNPLSNPVLQTVLLVSQSRGEKSCRKACEQLIDSTTMFQGSQSVASSDGDTVLTKLPELMTHDIASHLVEQIIMVSPSELYGQILEEYLKPHLLTMSLHPIANFILQRVISSAHTKEQFEQIYKCLAGNLEDILAHCREHVIVKLAEGCLQFGTKQEKFIKALMKTFHCHKPEERQSKIVPLISSLTTYEVFYKVSDDDDDNEDDDDKSDSDEEPEIAIPVLTKINLHGTVLLQKLLQFGNPRLITISLLDMKGISLKNLASDRHGSFVYDAIVTSRTVGEKTRENLVSKLKGHWLELACDKSGSRVFDKLWFIASVKQKESIAEELRKHEHRLQGDFFGKFVWKNCALSLFGPRRQEWINFQKGAAQKRKLFDDILGGGAKKQKVGDFAVKEDYSKECEDVNEIDNIFSNPKKQYTQSNNPSKRTFEKHKHEHKFKPKTFQPDVKSKRKHEGKK